ncbi:MAG: hypothetical protein M3431_06340 [Actinomycetota bacterium]|nr:hypothetical protein [Actinomycetota bacterium]
MREIRRHVLDVMRHNHERRDRAITDVYLWPGSVLIKQEIQGGGTAEIETSGQFSSVKYNDSTGAMCEIAL